MIDALFSPFDVRGLHLQSRFVMSPMSYYKNDGATPNDDFVEYHAARAGTALGLTITGATAIDRVAANNHPNLAELTPRTLAAWRRVVDAVHAAGGPIAMQLWHAGALFRIMPSHRPGPLESPSGLVEPGDVVGAPMTDVEIVACVDAFAEAGRRARALGFDAVEIHAAHGFLIDEFFWEGTNRRTDRWGGATLADRSAFAIEVVRAVRRAVGPDLPVFIRVSQWKEQDYGVKLAGTPAELVAWIGPLVDAGADVVHCSQRRFWLPEFPDLDPELNLAGWVRRELGVPTITVGSVGLDTDVMSFFDGAEARSQPLDELARRFDRGDFDLVAVGRALLADPQWVDHVRADRAASGPIRLADLDLRVR
ncbi:MAG TPA: hypothetical protein VNQ73_11595 [Ilumatobacter sp.]|nr:hypothetical protein [Ilumatobacter sp.]